MIGARRRGVTASLHGGATPTTLVSDSFNRADAASSLGTADTGQTWTTVVGTFGIASNLGAAKSVTANARAVIDAGAADATVQVDFSANTSAGLIFRDSDGSNHYVLTISSGTVYKATAGTYASFQALGAGASGLGTYKIVCSGTTAKVYKNGALAATVNVGSFNQTATRYGIYSGASAAPRYDNFLVTSP